MILGRFLEGYWKILLSNLPPQIYFQKEPSLPKCRAGGDRRGRKQPLERSKKCPEALPGRLQDVAKAAQDVAKTRCTLFFRCKDSARSLQNASWDGRPKNKPIDAPRRDLQGFDVQRRFKALLKRLLDTTKAPQHNAKRPFLWF